MDVIGRLTDASNGVFLVRVAGLAGEAGHADAAGGGYAVCKPVRYERPLWDFPDGTLADREAAAYLIDRAGGWGLIPATVVRDTALGTAAVQRWVGALPDGVPQSVEAASPSGDGEADLHDPADAHVVSILPAGAQALGWRPVLPAVLSDGTEVVVAHAEEPALASLAVLDAVLNNTDRKGSHVLRGRDGRLWGIDHGVSLHAQDKLRTILWGWEGERLPEDDVRRLRQLSAALQEGTLRAALAAHLTRAEIDALAARTERLLGAGVFPSPSPGWHAIPWPPL